MKTVEMIARDLDLNIFSMGAPHECVKGAYVGDLLSWVMGKASEGQAWITIMSNINVAAVATLSEISCIILAEHVKPDEALKAKAEEQGINLLGSRLSAYELAWRLHELTGL